MQALQVTALQQRRAKRYDDAAAGKLRVRATGPDAVQQVRLAAPRYQSSDCLRCQMVSSIAYASGDAAIVPNLTASLFKPVQQWCIPHGFVTGRMP